MLKLNLGCGSHTPSGWVNVDYALGAWIAKLPVFSLINKIFKIINIDWSDEIFMHDLRKKFPWEDNSVDVVYSSHTLEHLSRTEGQHFLRECYRVLKPNGVIRIVVPDLNAIINKYTQGAIAADEVLEQLYVSYESPKDGVLKQKLAPFIRFPHKCMYDTPTLLQIVSDIGFEVASKQGFESEIEDVRAIEQLSRTIEAVIVEGKKTPANTYKLKEFTQSNSLVS
ncbi:class I SAM-dependent methyltransferase [Scytonema sp. NUACC26]|uniref:class I SAM-dependent methyltransferase n=1 Tax=Scytonema sp. NUACC26 TaxID=3140176 RepID=UPI0034DBBC09